ncbi:MAG: RagB/SusD family nutrient uptake outer membrane protein [Paludibacter sp.]|jgi:hypothetical protein|nr:RagB/SusD family nutrient uptake outer membrane protein [Paludibacter sp.]
MKKIIISAILLMSLVNFSCSDYLTTNSPSVVDAEFVFSDISTAKQVMLGAYHIFESRCGLINGSGYYYNFEAVGSDIERDPGGIANNTGSRAAQCFIGGTESYSANLVMGIWAYNYSCISRCNAIISQIEQQPDFAELMAAGKASDWTDLYGQAAAMRATIYYEMSKWMGDLAYATKAGEEVNGATARDFIYESELEMLKKVEPLMYRRGENGRNPDQMTRTYVQGLIGRICLAAGGYALRRTDVESGFYHDLNGNSITFEVWGKDEARKCEYGRRNDWQRFYQTAKTYLDAAVNNGGSAQLITTDPRAKSVAGQIFGNPFQYVFQKVHDLAFSDESVYEATHTQGLNGDSETGYAWARPSDGGSAYAYPCKAFGRVRFYPSLYYSEYDSKDLRRDVTATVTGSVGDGTERLLDWGLGGKCMGGISVNKWDESRMNPPYYQAQRKSGMSFIYMRFSEIVLMLAEVEAAIGENGNATNHLKQVRERAFASPADANVDGFIAQYPTLVDAIIQERKLEFAGEGKRRWDLIRTGKFPEVAVAFHNQCVAQMEELKVNGYIQYPNGNQMPAYVWTKQVDSKAVYGYRLTTQCPAGQENDPVLYPSWRGQYDTWEKYAATIYEKSATTNTAIKGLFRYIDPESTEATALEADGYKKTPWGIMLYAITVDNVNWTANETQAANFAQDVFAGYTAADLAAKKAPMIMFPYEANVVINCGVTNGYGFPQQ